jgi:hypothetical protein
MRFTQFWLVACFSALLVCPSGAADEDADDGSSPLEKPTVIELTPDNFNELVEESDEYWIVEFFAPWYSACISLRAAPPSLRAQVRALQEAGARV